MALFGIELIPILLALAHVALGVVVLILAKLCRDIVSPYPTEVELTSHDNPAFGMAVAGYYAATVIVFLGATRAQGLPLDAGSMAVLQALGLDLAWAVGGIIALNLTRVFMDRVLITQCNNSQEITEKRNLAAGAVEFGCYIASGLVLSGAIGAKGGTLVTTVVFFVISLLTLVILGRGYLAFAGYNVAAEVRKGNFSAGVPFGLTLIALSILMLKATSGEFISWGVNLGYFAADAISGFLLLMLLRWVTDLALLPHAKIEEEVVRDHNVNAGLVEGVLAIGIATIILFLL
ncbi:MAG: DUF350 domain-containing protein [Bryobacteraceae bacterium]